MFCIKCGQQLPDDARFCFKCGAATVQQNGVANSARQFDDDIEAKAEEFVAAGPAGADDYVAPVVRETSATQFAAENLPPTKLPRRYTRTRELMFNDNEYLYKITREDNVTGEVVYSLFWNDGSKRQSEWFDEIEYDDYDGYGVYVVEKDGKRGLMEEDTFHTYMSDGKDLTKVRDGVYWVYRNKHWVLVNIKNFEIEELYSYDEMEIIIDGVHLIAEDVVGRPVTIIVSKNDKSWFWDFDDATDLAINPLSCEFDDIQACERRDLFIVRCGNKYGCVFKNGNTLDYPINCVLDAVSSAVFDGGKVKVEYNGQEYFMDKEGCLWTRRRQGVGTMKAIGIRMLLYLVAIVMGTFLSVKFNGFLLHNLSLSEALGFIGMLVMMVMILLPCNKIICMVCDFLEYDQYDKADIDLRKVEE